MTKPKITLGLLIILLVAVSSSSAQEFTLTTTPAKIILPNEILLRKEGADCYDQVFL